MFYNRFSMIRIEALICKLLQVQLRPCLHGVGDPGLVG